MKFSHVIAMCLGFIMRYNNLKVLLAKKSRMIISGKDGDIQNQKSNSSLLGEKVR